MKAELQIIVSDTDVLLRGALARGIPAFDAMITGIIAVSRKAETLDDVSRMLATPLSVVDRPALGALLTALVTTMVTADLLGRAHVMGRVRDAKIEVAPIGRGFGAPGRSFADLGTLDVEPLPPLEAIRLFEQRVPLMREAFDEIIEAYRGRAFTIAGQESMQAVQVVQGWLDKALADGLTLSDFRKGLDAAAASGGITAVNPFHAETVFINNMQTAYNAGRWEMYHAPEVVEAFPLFEFNAIHEERAYDCPCPEMDGYIAERDSPVWRTHWPQLHHRCRCTVTAISKYEIQRDGIQVSTRTPPDPAPGFGGNAAMAIRTAGLHDTGQGGPWK